MDDDTSPQNLDSKLSGFHTDQLFSELGLELTTAALRKNELGPEKGENGEAKALPPPPCELVLHDVLR